jgi:hypothetical protein
MNSLVLAISTATLLGGDYLSQAPAGRIGTGAGPFGVGVYSGAGMYRNGQASAPNFGRRTGSRFTPRPPGGFGGTGRSMFTTPRGATGGQNGFAGARGASGVYGRPQIPAPPTQLGGRGYAPNFGFRR